MQQNKPIQKEKKETIKPLIEPIAEINILDKTRNFFIDWRVISFIVISVIFIFLSRLIRLGFKPPMHDETMFFFYSYLFAKSGNYTYMPILHGPFMLFFSALFYIFIGATDFTIRLGVAVLGIGLFGWLWGMRKYLGEKATLAAFFLFALSPTVMYYSRFWRNDIPLEFAFLGALYFFLRFLEEGKGSHIFWSIIFCTIAFCIKENSIFFFFTFFNFFLLFLIVKIVENYLAERKTKKFPQLTFNNLFTFKIIIPVLITIFILIIIKFIFFWRTFQGIIFKDFTVGKFLTFGVPFKYYFLFILSVAAGFIILSLLIFTIKNNYDSNKIISRFAKMIYEKKFYILGAIMGAIFLYIIIFTSFLTNRKGFFQIYRETFDYWWGQHLEHRIKGAFHYYMPILLIYEILPLTIVLAGWIYSMMKNKTLKKYILPAWIVFTLIYTMIFAYRKTPIDVVYWDKTFHLTSPTHIYLILTITLFGMIQVVRYILKKETFLAFLFYWFWLNLLLYSYAGEKVPWINLHITIPLLLTAAIYIQKMFNDISYSKLKKIAIPVFVILASYTFASSMKLCFVHPWDTRERLIYGHTTIEVQDTATEVKRIAALLGTRETTEVNVEMGLLVNWPLRWYLRDYTNLREIGNVETWKTPVCYVNWDRVKPDAPPNMFSKNIKDNYHITKVRMLTWWQPPMPDYKLLKNIWKVLIPEDKLNPGTSGDIYNAKQEWRKIYRYIMFRETFDALNAQWPTVSSQDCAFCVRKDIFESMNYPSEPPSQTANNSTEEQNTQQ